MGYDNDNSSPYYDTSAPGQTRPMAARLPPAFVMQGLGHNTIAQGSLSSPHFSGYGNTSGAGLTLGNTYPINMSMPPFSPYPLADTDFNINLDIGGGGGGGGGHPESVVVTPVSWLTTTTSTASLVTTYSIDSNSNFSAAVNDVVNTGSFNTFNQWNGAEGTMSANSATDTAAILGDWTSSVGAAGTHYIKTSAADASDVMSISFEKFLHERIDSDDDTIITAGQKAAVLKFEGGAGITTSAAIYDGSSAGDNLDTKVTIAVDPDTLDTMDLLIVTSTDGTAGTVAAASGSLGTLTYTTYAVSKIKLVTSSGAKYTASVTGTLYDFSKHKLNLPEDHTGTNPTYEFQDLEQYSIVSARKVSDGGSAWSGNIWVMGGIPTLDFSCS